MSWFDKLIKKILSLFKKDDKPKEETPIEERKEPQAPSYTGESPRKPERVKYVFHFSDGSNLEFIDFIKGDYWGEAGKGRLTKSDGSQHEINVNVDIRHAYVLRRLQDHQTRGLAVTLRNHGDRLYWFTNPPEGEGNPSKVDMYEDGYMPHAERMVDNETQLMGWAPIIRVKAKVLRWQN